jgi:hypothetical protein
MSKKINYGICVVILILVAIYFTLGDIQKQQSQSLTFTEQENSEEIQSAQSQRGMAIIEHAYKNKLNSVQVHSEGKVIAVLPDDNQGSRHQKFILELANGQTLLVAHNIDLAPRIPDLKKEDSVEFYGEYEYSNKGGVIHWTHHDPKRKHVEGWLKHNGQIYK